MAFVLRQIKNEIHQMGKSLKQMLLELVQVTVSFFFYLDEISNEAVMAQIPRF